MIQWLEAKKNCYTLWLLHSLSPSNWDVNVCHNVKLDVNLDAKEIVKRMAGVVESFLAVLVWAA